MMLADTGWCQWCWVVLGHAEPCAACGGPGEGGHCSYLCPLVSTIHASSVSPVLALLANTSSTLLHHNKILTLCPDSESDTWGHVQWLPDTWTVWPRWAPDHDTAHGHTSDQCQYWHRLTWSNEATSNFYQMCSLTKQKRFPQQKWAMEYFLTTHCLLGEEWRERIQTMLLVTSP